MSKECIEWPPVAVKDISFRAYSPYTNDEVVFDLAARCHDDSIWRARLMWEEEEDINLKSPPLMRLSRFYRAPSHPLLPKDGLVLQVLMDDLWNCGVRPTEARGSAGQLDATHKHLRDMRKIAGKFLEVNLE